MSSSAVGGAVDSWDFTAGLSRAYSSGGPPTKELAPGVFGLFAGDSSVDGQITALDFSQYLAGTTAGLTGYQMADYNMDGQITALDFGLYLANTTRGARSHVPE